MVNARLGYEGVSGDVAEAIVLSVFQVLVEPLPKYIARKSKVRDFRAALVDQRVAVTADFEDCDRACNLACSAEIMSEFKKLVDQIAETERPLAFREMAQRDLACAAPHVVKNLQWKYFLAAASSDLWSALYNKGSW